MKLSEKKKTLYRSAAGLSCFFLIWELVVRLGLVSSRRMSTFTEVIATFITKLTDADPDGATIIEHFTASFSVAISGFALAALIGVPLGLAMGYNKYIQSYANTIFEILRPIPPIAWIPIIMLLLGIGQGAKIFIIFIAAVVPAVINSYTGVRRTPEVYRNVGRSLGMSDFKIFTKICVPYAMPSVFTGLRLSLNTAWVALVAAELLASTKGLGYMIQIGRVLAKPSIIITGMFVIGCSGAVMSMVLSFFEHKFSEWSTK